MKPVIEAFSRPNNPAYIATIAIIISAEFPNVTLSSDHTVGP